MALAALRKCGEVGCNRLVREARCKEHGSGPQRPGSQLHLGHRWRKLRLRYLVDNPLCIECKRSGRTEAAVDVHHKIRRMDAPELAYDVSNLESLCRSCHSKETSRGC